MPPKTQPLEFSRLTPAQMQRRADDLFEALRRRRSVRAFSDEPLPLDVVRRAIATASQAPSGANRQPWTFVLVTDPTTKHRIRGAAEGVERELYAGRAGEAWLSDLGTLGTTPDKAFLETAPALIAVFAQIRSSAGDKHYYVRESVGIACGFLVAALHLAGLATLTYTPSPMGFLARILARPRHERAFMLMPVGYPAADCVVPKQGRKNLEEVLLEA